MVIATTKTIAQIPHLATFLADTPRAVAGWGRKPSGRRAGWVAKALRRPCVLLEDGFVRSLERRSPPLSLLVDDVGVYYDATRPSRMEMTIAQGADDVQSARAEALAARWREGGISKYNHADEYDGPLPDSYVLVVDQTLGDLSISGGQASARSFTAMLAAAIMENPQSDILVKVHPDVLSKAKRGHFADSDLRHPRVHVIGSDCHCAKLIQGASAVYCVTSLMGFEGLLWGKTVRCFGMPFYAGWDLTLDEASPPSRRGRASLQDAIHAALIDVARYAAPSSGHAWTAEEAIDHLALGRKLMLASRNSPLGS